MSQISVIMSIKDFLDRCNNATEGAMISKKNGFAFDESILSKAPSIYINSNKISSCIKHIQSKKIKSVILNSGVGFETNNLSFLEEIPFIEELVIIPNNANNIDVSPINQLKQLRY